MRPRDAASALENLADLLVPPGPVVVILPEVRIVREVVAV
jgi:hypothetical protein